jgi:quinol-cytochrome oxidoreductase complex cytochrome b subunit
LSPVKPENTEPDNLKKPGWTKAIVNFFFERLGLDSAAALAAKKRVPIHSRSIFYFLGGMALFLFGIQVITGILLSLYYKPSPDQAFESVRAIVTEVDFGWLFRSIHSWSANLLIGVLFLHILTTYIMRAYRPPREFTWLTGIALLGVFMTFGFSGYLLPWNQLAFFATSVGTAIAGGVPVIGKYLLLMARGGENITGDTLARFYALHVVILPLSALVIVGGHLFLVQKHEISVPEDMIKKYGSAKKAPSMPFVPHFLLRDMVGWYVALGLLAALAALFPWELGQKADPFGSPPPGIKPEWYFLFMFQALKDLPSHPIPSLPWLEGETVGILFFGFLGLMVALVPFLDRGAAAGRPRRVLNFCAALTVAFFVFMTIRSLVIKPPQEQSVKDQPVAVASPEGTPEKATP